MLSLNGSSFQVEDGKAFLLIKSRDINNSFAILSKKYIFYNASLN